MINGTFEILKTISQKSQRQDSLADQLRELKAFANKLGMYDAADLIQTLVETQKAKYDPNFGDDRFCECGHKYYRHFDTHEDMYPCGCKYCGCYTFELDEFEVYEQGKSNEIE